MLGVGGLVGWIFGINFLIRIAPGYKGIAPIVAASLIILGVILLRLVTGRIGKSERIALALIAGFISLYGLLDPIGFFLGADPNFEDSFTIYLKKITSIPFETMSPIAGALLFLLGAAILLLMLRGPSTQAPLSSSQQKLSDAAMLPALFAGLLALICILGYAYGAPKLYGSTLIPIAVIAVLGAFLLAIGVIASAGRSQWPLRTITGNSARARLLRTFVPLVIVAALSISIMEHRLTTLKDVSHVLLGSFFAVAFAFLAGLIALRAAHSIGGSLDEAEMARQLAEKQAIQAERQRFNDVLETLPAYVVLLTPDYHVAFANRIFRERFGEDLGRCCFEFLFNRTEPCENCETYNALKNMTSHRWEWLGPDGRNYDIYDFPFTDTDGSTLILEMGVDITELKQTEAELIRYQEHLEELVLARTADLDLRNAQLAAEIAEREEAEKALRQSEERYRSLFESMQEGFALHEIICNEDGKPVDYRFLEINPAFERLTGLKRETVVGKTALEVLPHLESFWLETYGRVALTGEPATLENFAAELGRYFQAIAYSPHPRQFAVVFSDVTQRTLVERALRESQTDLNHAQAVAHTGSWRMDVRNNELRWSDESYRIFGIPLGTPLTYESFLATVHPEDLDFVNSQWQAALRGAPYDIEHRIIADGVVKWVRERAELELDEEGNLIGGFGTAQDITELKLAEQERERLLEERRRQTNLLETILENTDAHLVYLDRNFNFIWVNSAYARACRRSREEFVGRNHFELYPNDENEAIFKKVRDTGEPARFIEKPFVFPDMPERGTTYWDWTLIPLKNAQGEVESFVFSLSDVTEKVKTRQQLLEVERLRTQMAEAIALEINHRMKNNLMLVSGILDLQLNNQFGLPDATTALRQAKARIAALSTVHEQMYERRSERVDLSGVLRRIAEMVVGGLATNEVQLSISDTPLLISSRAATVLALVGNELVTNALKHGAGDSVSGKRRVDVTLSHQNKAVNLSVWSAGNPLPPDFDLAKQAGLGLRLCQELIEGQLRGRFELQSSNDGTMSRAIVPEESLWQEDNSAK